MDKIYILSNDLMNRTGICIKEHAVIEKTETQVKLKDFGWVYIDSIDKWSIANMVQSVDHAFKIESSSKMGFFSSREKAQDSIKKEFTKLREQLDLIEKNILNN